MVINDKDRTVIAVQNQASFRRQLFKAAGEHEIPARRVLQYASRRWLCVRRKYPNIDIPSRKRASATRYSPVYDFPPSLRNTAYPISLGERQ